MNDRVLDLPHHCKMRKYLARFSAIAELLVIINSQISQVLQHNYLTVCLCFGGICTYALHHLITVKYSYRPTRTLGGQL